MAGYRVVEEHFSPRGSRGHAPFDILQGSKQHSGIRFPCPDFSGQIEWERRSPGQCPRATFVVHVWTCTLREMTVPGSRSTRVKENVIWTTRRASESIGPNALKRTREFQSNTLNRGWAAYCALPGKPWR